MPTKKQQQHVAAKEFSDFWRGKGYEKGETQSFWLALLSKVFGVDEPEKFIHFEQQVKEDTTNFIDARIDATRVLIEQKSLGKNLRAPIKQSDGSLLSPFQQARRYVTSLPVSQHPRWIVTCNFAEFLVYDMERPNGEPESILLENLEKEYYRLNFLIDTGNAHLKREMEISIKAGEIVGVLYDEILKQYKDATSEHSLKSLNMLCVRLVFCLYAEDAEIFGHKSMFYDYLNRFDSRDLREALIKLFIVLDTKEADRDPYLDKALAAFPYVNGGLFTETDIEIPNFTDGIKCLLLEKSSDDFDWSEISPTIFGAVFESTLNPVTRRTGGMHYTSIENIHKVIDPLFLDSLKEEFEQIRATKTEKARQTNLIDFQDKLARLTFLDPACGSGNFLTETYISLRRLENEILKEKRKDTQSFIGGDFSPIRISINQFFGIEINDFAVTVARTALWIAESQMMRETEGIVGRSLDFLPLKSNANIVEGNALQLDWNYLQESQKTIPTIYANRTNLYQIEEPKSLEISEPVIHYGEINLYTKELNLKAGQTIPTPTPTHYDYIMGNPPFVGYSLQSKEQKKDLDSLMHGFGKNIDYVSGWYYKTAEILQNKTTRAALVSTNSITQGEQVTALWKPLFERFGIHIDFAYRTFRWNSESVQKAHVHCVIIGFSCSETEKKIIFNESGNAEVAKNINGYLIDAPDIFIGNTKRALCNIPEMGKGSIPVDGGNLLIEADEIDDFLKKEPQAKKFIKKFVGSEEFINNKNRYCLWLINASPAEIKKCPLIMDRLQKVKKMRLASTKKATRKYADYPSRFMELRQPSSEYILVPSHSSENRKYIPMGYVSPEVISSNANMVIPNATLYHFGILTSNVHMAWMRVVCGRLEMRYRYSKDIVYNNFPWPTPSEEQKTKIEQTAQAILDARKLYPDSSFADLYDETVMPPELRRAHQANDRAVMAAYGFNTKMNESECVAELFKLYEELQKD